MYRYNKCNQLLKTLNFRIMNIERINQIVKEITEDQVLNIVSEWKANDTEKFNTYNTLVRLGDSKKMACATTIETKCKNTDMYKLAYES